MQWFQYHLYTKCSHLYNNVEYFFWFVCFYFFPALLSAFWVPTSVTSTSKFMYGEKIGAIDETVFPLRLLHPVQVQTGITIDPVAWWSSITASVVPIIRPHQLLELWNWLNWEQQVDVVGLWHRLGCGKKLKKHLTALNESRGCQFCCFK